MIDALGDLVHKSTLLIFSISVHLFQNIIFLVALHQLKNEGPYDKKEQWEV